jgi:hypothetical protein
MNEPVHPGTELKLVGVSEAAVARTELYRTLGQLRDRLNYAQRVDDAVDDARVRLREVQRNRPLAFLAGCVSVATLSGIAVWSVAAQVSRYIR